MADHVTYYAIVDDGSSREEPAGLLRRIKHDRGQRDEAFGYDDLAWANTSLLYTCERDGGKQLLDITEAEADEIVARLRRAATE